MSLSLLRDDIYISGTESDHNSGRSKENGVDNETEIILEDERRALALLQVFSR